MEILFILLFINNSWIKRGSLFELTITTDVFDISVLVNKWKQDQSKFFILIRTDGYTQNVWVLLGPLSQTKIPNLPNRCYQMRTYIKCTKNDWCFDITTYQFDVLIKIATLSESFDIDSFEINWLIPIRWNLLLQLIWTVQVWIGVYSVQRNVQIPSTKISHWYINQGIHFWEDQFNFYFV